MKKAILAVWNFYVEGFRQMTWGRQLWFLIFLKIIILFVVLRAFFFRPILAEMSDEQLFSQMEEAMVAAVREQYAAAVMAQMGALTMEQLAGALDLLLKPDRLRATLRS